MVLDQTQQNALYNKIVGHLLNLKPEELIIDFQLNHCPSEIWLEQNRCCALCANCWNDTLAKTFNK